MLKLKLEITDPNVLNMEWLNPRNKPLNRGKMCLWHKKYALGDTEVIKGLSPREFLRTMLQAAGEVVKIGLGMSELEDKVKEHYHFLPIYGLDHSTFVISSKPFDNTWDSGRLGFIYQKKSLTSYTEEEMNEFFEKEIEEYNTYIQGIGFSVILSFYNDDKKIKDIFSDTFLGFPEWYTIDALINSAYIKAFKDDFNKNKTSWLPPLTKWARLKTKEEMRGSFELKSAAEDIKEISKAEPECESADSEELDRFTFKKHCLYCGKTITGLSHNLAGIVAWQKQPCPFCNDKGFLNPLATTAEFSFKRPKASKDEAETVPVVRNGKVMAEAKKVMQCNKCKREELVFFDTMENAEVWLGLPCPFCKDGEFQSLDTPERVSSKDILSDTSYISIWEKPPRLVMEVKE